jgi:hypothetical protein
MWEIQVRTVDATRTTSEDGRTVLEWVWRKWGGEVCTGLIWLMIGIGGGIVWSRLKFFGFQKWRWISWLAEQRQLQGNMTYDSACAGVSRNLLVSHILQSRDTTHGTDYTTLESSASRRTQNRSRCKSWSCRRCQTMTSTYWKKPKRLRHQQKTTQITHIWHEAKVNQSNNLTEC